MPRIWHKRDTPAHAQLVALLREAMLPPEKKAALPPRLPRSRRQARQYRHTAVYQQFIRAVRQSEDYVYITSAFFNPNADFLALLQEAHSRGVDVRILMPEHSSRRLEDLIALSYTPRYLKAGLRIFHYRKHALRHKSAIVDDRWATIGNLSFDTHLHGREANIITTDKDEVWQLRRQFFRDLHGSHELTWTQWRHVPLWIKTLAYATRGLRKIL